MRRATQRTALLANISASSHLGNMINPDDNGIVMLDWCVRAKSGSEIEPCNGATLRLGAHPLLPRSICRDCGRPIHHATSRRASDEEVAAAAEEHRRSLRSGA